jgi:hypothetical protein
MSQTFTVSQTYLQYKGELVVSWNRDTRQETFPVPTKYIISLIASSTLFSSGTNSVKKEQIACVRFQMIVFIFVSSQHGCVAKCMYLYEYLQQATRSSQRVVLTSFWWRDMIHDDWEVNSLGSYSQYPVPEAANRHWRCIYNLGLSNDAVCNLDYIASSGCMISE